MYNDNEHACVLYDVVFTCTFYHSSSSCSSYSAFITATQISRDLTPRKAKKKWVGRQVAKVGVGTLTAGAGIFGHGCRGFCRCLWGFMVMLGGHHRMAPLDIWFYTSHIHIYKEQKNKGETLPIGYRGSVFAWIIFGLKIDGPKT